jgi:hypothetical protein
VQVLEAGRQLSASQETAKVFQKLRIWWQLRKLEKDRAFLLKMGNDPRSQELLPLVEAEIARLWASQIKLRHPEIFKDEG